MSQAHIFGWCVDGHCHPTEGSSGCPGEVVTFYVDEKNKAHETGRRKCEHSCHHREGAA